MRKKTIILLTTATLAASVFIGLPIANTANADNKYAPTAPTQIEVQTEEQTPKYAPTAPRQTEKETEKETPKYAPTAPRQIEVQTEEETPKYAPTAPRETEKVIEEEAPKYAPTVPVASGEVLEYSFTPAKTNVKNKSQIDDTNDTTYTNHNHVPYSVVINNINIPITIPNSANIEAVQDRIDLFLHEFVQIRAYSNDDKVVKTANNNLSIYLASHNTGVGRYIFDAKEITFVDKNGVAKEYVLSGYQTIYVGLVEEEGFENIPNQSIAYAMHGFGGDTIWFQTCLFDRPGYAGVWTFTPKG